MKEKFGVEEFRSRGISEQLVCLEVDQSTNYSACNGDSRMLHMVDFVNVKDNQDCLKIFDMCRAHKGTEGTCGMYAPSYFWSQPIKTQERYYCKIQWDVVVKVHSRRKSFSAVPFPQVSFLHFDFPQVPFPQTCSFSDLLWWLPANACCLVKGAV